MKPCKICYKEQNVTSWYGTMTTFFLLFHAVIVVGEVSVELVCGVMSHNHFAKGHTVKQYPERLGKEHAWATFMVEKVSFRIYITRQWKWCFPDVNGNVHSCLTALWPNFVTRSDSLNLHFNFIYGPSSIVAKMLNFVYFWFFTTNRLLSSIET